MCRVFSWSLEFARSFQLESFGCTEISWSQELAVSFQLESGACSEFSAGVRSLHRVLFWSQEFAVSFHLSQELALSIQLELT